MGTAWRGTGSRDERLGELREAAHRESEGHRPEPLEYWSHPVFPLVGNLLSCRARAVGIALGRFCTSGRLLGK